MGTIPPQSPGVGGITPNPQPNEDQTSVKSETRSLRSDAMEKSSVPKEKSPEEGDNGISKIWEKGKLNEFTPKATPAGIIRNLQNAFDQIPR